jgi:hypothetical protein
VQSHQKGRQGVGQLSDISAEGRNSYKWLPLSLEDQTPLSHRAKQTSALSQTGKLPERQRRNPAKKEWNAIA